MHSPPYGRDDEDATFHYHKSPTHPPFFPSFHPRIQSHIFTITTTPRTTISSTTPLQQIRDNEQTLCFSSCIPSCSMFPFTLALNIFQFKQHPLLHARSIDLTLLHRWSSRIWGIIPAKSNLNLVEISEPLLPPQNASKIFDNSSYISTIDLYCPCVQ